MVGSVARGSRGEHQFGGGVEVVGFADGGLHHLAAEPLPLMAMCNDHVFQPYGEAAGVEGGAEGEHADGLITLAYYIKVGVVVADYLAQLPDGEGLSGGAELGQQPIDGGKGLGGGGGLFGYLHGMGLITWCKVSEKDAYVCQNGRLCFWYAD